VDLLILIRISLNRFIAKDLKLNKGKHDSATDEELVEMFRNSHDPLYMGELYIRYTQLVYGVSLKYLKNQEDAKDATMQIFEKLIIELKKHKVAVFRPWLFVVVKNFCMMEFRKDSRMKNMVEEVKMQTANVENPNFEHLSDNEEREMILQQMEKGVKRLREEQRKCITLFYLDNKSYKEISKATGYSLNDIKSHIQNGKRNLKNYLTE